MHFIFKHKNPVTDAVEEKHVSSPPSAVTALQTTLYTIVRRLLARSAPACHLHKPLRRVRWMWCLLVPSLIA